ncbi:MAG: hypothetical protein KAS12_00710, partial [Candidatus Aenigmarchaeota archaeon]|nr:hypothetical protein [Candidatus Aenigmarchaeota archaeon]
VLEFGKGYFKISKFGSNTTFNNYYPASPVVNATGYMLSEMTTAEWCDSDKSYSLGQNFYITGLLGSSYYKDNSTIPQPYGSLPFMLYGNLSSSYMTLPDGSVNYTRGSSISLDGFVKDDCVAVKSDSAKYGTEYILSKGVTNYSVIASLATTSWNSPGGAPLGWYNVTMVSYSEGSELGLYTNGTVTLENAFYLSTVPQSDYVDVSPASDGWSKSPFNFTINVTDEDNDTVTVYLYLKKGSDSWGLYDSWVCENCNDNQTTFQRNFTQYEIDTWQYVFNASDQSGNVNTSLQSGSFTVEKDDISFINPTPTTFDINRTSGSSTLSLRIYDEDNQTYTTNLSSTSPNEVQFFITNDSAASNWREETTDTKNTTHYYFDFDPGCEYVANQQEWKVNTTSDYFNTNDTKTFTTLYANIYGTLTATQTFPDTSTNYSQDDMIPVNGTLVDDCGTAITGADVYFNITLDSNTYRCPTSGPATDVGAGVYSCNWDSAGKSAGYYNITMYSNKAYNNPDTDSRQNAFFLISPISLSLETVTPSTAGWGVDRNFSIMVSHYTDVNLTVWHSKGVSGGPYSIANTTILSNPSNTQADLFKNYTCSDINTWFYKFNATDINSEGNATTTFHDYTLTKDDIVIGQSFVGNASYVNRSETLDPVSMLLAHSVNDTVRNVFINSTQATIYLNVTNDNAENFTTVISNTTNSTGYANFDFLPDCSYSVGE